MAYKLSLAQPSCWAFCFKRLAIFYQCPQRLSNKLLLLAVLFWKSWAGLSAVIGAASQA
jgi:hypothetical protein